MLIEENDAGGSSVFVFLTDDLGDVPDSHQGLITPAVREAFIEPLAYFHHIANVCPFPHMAAWLRALLEEENGWLGLHRSFREEWTSVGFYWSSERVRTAEIRPSNGVASPHLPPVLREYYSLVDSVSWMPFGCAGGVSGSAGHDPLTAFDEMYHGRGAGLDPEKTRVFGGSPCGDMMIYTDDGRGGWLSSENGAIHLLGTIEETLEWVYAALLADRTPEFDPAWFTAST